MKKSYDHLQFVQHKKGGTGHPFVLVLLVLLCILQEFLPYLMWYFVFNFQVKKTEASKITFEEVKFINTSLSALGNVVSSLSNKTVSF